MHSLTLKLAPLQPQLWLAIGYHLLLLFHERAGVDIFHYFENLAIQSRIYELPLATFLSYTTLFLVLNLVSKDKFYQINIEISSALTY